MIIFFAVIYQHAMSLKTTMNAEYYLSVSKFLSQHISAKHHELVEKWSLHHNNTCLHVAFSVQQYLSKCKLKLCPPYSPDLALCDFWLFLFKKKLYGRKFNAEFVVISGVQDF